MNRSIGFGWVMEHNIIVAWTLRKALKMDIIVPSWQQSDYVAPGAGAVLARCRRTRGQFEKGQLREPRAQRPPALRARRRRRQLFARRRAPGPAQVDGLATGRRPGSATRRATPAAHDAQAHRHRFRPRRARACASRRRGRRGRGVAGAEPADRAERPPARDDAGRPRQHRPRAAAGRVRPRSTRRSRSRSTSPRASSISSARTSTSRSAWANCATTHRSPPAGWPCSPAASTPRPRTSPAAERRPNPRR